MFSCHLREKRILDCVVSKVYETLSVQRYCVDVCENWGKDAYKSLTKPYLGFRSKRDTQLPN